MFVLKINVFSILLKPKVSKSLWFCGRQFLNFATLHSKPRIKLFRLLMPTLQ